MSSVVSCVFSREHDELCIGLESGPTSAKAFMCHQEHNWLQIACNVYRIKIAYNIMCSCSILLKVQTLLKYRAFFR